MRINVASIKDLKNLDFSSILSDTLYVTIGAFLGSIFSYLLQLGLARLLTVEDFGVFSTMLALATILAIPTGALQNSIIKVVSTLNSENKHNILSALYIKISLGLLIFGLFGFLLLVLATPFLSSYLNIYDKGLFIAFGVFFAVSFLTVPPMSYMQGLQRFRAYGFYLTIAGASRVAIPMIMLLLGYKVGGVFVGIALSVIAMFLVGYLILKKNMVSYEKESLGSYYKTIAGFGLVTLLVGAGMNLLNNVDILLVKHFFDEHTSGIYAGIVTMGKVFLFGAGTVTILMFPQISALHNKGENFIPRFKQLLYLQLFMVFGGIFVMFFIPGFLTRTLFGHAFESAIDYLPKFSIFVGFYILVNFFIMFLLAINKTKAWIFLLPAVLAQFILIELNHETLHQIININIGVSAVLLLVVISYSWYNISNASIDRSTNI